MIARKASRSSNRSTSAYRFSDAASQDATIAWRRTRRPPTRRIQDILHGKPHRVIASATGQPFGSVKEGREMPGRRGRVTVAMITFIPRSVGYRTNRGQCIGYFCRRGDPSPESRGENDDEDVVRPDHLKRLTGKNSHRKGSPSCPAIISEFRKAHTRVLPTLIAPQRCPIRRYSVVAFARHVM
jgi:hypothetical protein